jgi:tetratricopeptide (TPR) repeat protein
VRKNDKKVKAVYDDVHKTFLAKYEMKNRFEDIFNNGYYNCVSGTALYGMAFQHLNIPFTIKEKPTHVYLIAYPDQERILVETTTPVGGFVAMTPHFKQGFVKMLKEQKLISSQEYASQKTDELFDRFYFGSQGNITLLQLLGLQYFNEGVYFLQEEKHLDGLHQLEKAYLFYPSERVAYMLMSALHETFKQRETKDLVHASCLSHLARYKKYGITSDMVLGEFGRVMDDLLFDKGQNEKLEEYFNELESSLKDEGLRTEISFMYHYENGRLLFNQARFRESISFFESALKLKPKHQETNRIFIAALANLIKNSTNAEAIKTLEGYAQSFPTLLENNIFNEMLGTLYLIEMEMSFETNKPEEGEKHKKKFETFYSAHQEVTYYTQAIGQAYSAAAVYYFRKGQTPKAKTIIARGLEFSPNNYELITRKRMIE